MDAPKVSVIVPTFNRAHMLGTAIESVLGQTFRDLELLIVDDGSADETGSVAGRYAKDDARVRYLRREHRGMSAAMNAGVECARGQYIARLDSDDIWLPDLLATEIAVLDAQPEIGLVYSKAEGMNADLSARPFTTGYAPHYPHDALRSMLWDDCTCNITVVVRRGCFECAGWFDESLATSEDWDMQLRIAVHDRFAFVDRVLARVRTHDGSITAPRSPQFADYLESRVRVLDKFFARSELPPGAAAMKPLAYRNLHIHIGFLWIGAGRWRRAFESFGRAMRVSGKPAPTLGRIAFFLLANQVLKHTAAGRTLLRWQSDLRLRWRQRKQPATRASRDGRGAR